MSRATITGAGEARDVLFPFTLTLGTTLSSGYVTARSVPGTICSLVGMGICVLLLPAAQKYLPVNGPVAYE